MEKKKLTRLSIWHISCIFLYHVPWKTTQVIWFHRKTGLCPTPTLFFFFFIIGFIITSAEWSPWILCKSGNRKSSTWVRAFPHTDHSIPQIITHHCNITSHSVLTISSLFVLASGEWASSSSLAPQALPTAASQSKTQQISRKHTTSVT